MPAAADSIRRSSSSGQLRPRRAVERLEFYAEALAQRAQIGFLVQRAGGDQNAVGADAQRSRPALGVFDNVGREQRADAIDFRAAAA